MVFTLYVEDALTFELRFRRPYDWTWMLSFLGARAIAGVEEMNGLSYKRAIRLKLDGHEYIGTVIVKPSKAKPAFSVSVSKSLAKVSDAALEKVGTLMDVATDPSVIAGALGPMAAANPGLRVPGAFDGFEIGVRAILGQQVSVAAARTIAGRFAAAFGTPIRNGLQGDMTAFPGFQRIADLSVDNIARLGIISARARSIITLARALSDGIISLNPESDAVEEIVRLRELPGIGEWTAQYIAMRAHKWADAFPHTDFGVMKAMGETNPKRVLERAEAWRPWRSYAVMHLWHSLHQ